MRYIYTFLITLFMVSLGFGQTLSTGDIAIIGVGVDDEEILVVALADIPAGESVFFTDDEWNVSAFNSGEGFYEWVTPVITAGTVLTITTTSTTAGGTVTQRDGSFALGNTGDGVFLYQTSTNVYNTGTYTLLGFAGEDAGDAGSLTGSGLTLGTTAVYFAGDNGIYNGARTSNDKAGHLANIYNNTNWVTSGTAQTFDTTTFTFSGGSPITSVEFASASASVSEGVGTTDLTFSITNPDGTNATSFDVELTTGDSTDINGYTTQTVTFAAGSSTDETLTITVTDDTIFEGDETLTFTITGVTGGNNATLGTQSTFDLTIEENDANPAVAFWHEPFNNNNLYTVTAGGEGNDGTADYFQITDGSNINESYTNIDGTFHASQDIDDGGWTNSDSPSQLTWTEIDVSEFTTLSFKGSFASNGGGIDNTDFVLVEYQIDSGGWVNLLAFENTGDFNNNFFEDTDFDGTGDGLELSGTFQEFEKSIPVGSILDLRITVSLNSGGEDLAFDNFKVNGIYNGYAYSDGSWYPADPDGTTAASDAIVTDGTAVLSTNASLNQVIIKSGASLTINQGVTLTANTLDLESTSSSYASLINNGTITGTITYNRYTNTIGSGSTGGNDLIASPFSGQTFGAFATANDGVLSASGTLRAFAPFNTGSGNYENYDTSTDNATPITAGTGYRAATDSGESLAFSGTLNSGDITIPLSDGASSYWNLIGNVYPSYLDLGDFLATNDNTIIQDAFYGIYGYDANASDGSVFTIWDLNTDGDFLIAPGQGFFVAAPSGGGTSVTFTESMRRTGLADDFIVGRGQNNTGVTRAGINLNTASKSYVTNFYFRDINTLGLDPGYDTGAFDQESDGLFSNLVADDIGIALVNQSLPLESLSNVSIPLVVNATAGEQLNFSLDSNTSLPANIEVYLEDILTGTSTLLNTSDYIFTPTSNLSGPGRFYVVFSDNALGVNEDSLNNVNIYALERELFIKGQLAHNTNATLFDMQGRAVLTVSLDTESQINTIDISGLSNGIYIVQLSNIEYSKSKKVILK